MMKYYNSLKELIEAKAKETHKANLERGGVLNQRNERISNIENERQAAKGRVSFTSVEYAPFNIGIKIKKPAYYIKNFGYTSVK